MPYQLRRKKVSDHVVLFLTFDIVRRGKVASPNIPSWVSEQEHLNTLIALTDFDSQPVPWGQTTLKELMHEAARLTREQLLEVGALDEARDMVLFSTARAFHLQDIPLALVIYFCGRW